MKSKLLWKILLVVGILPFAVALLTGIYNAIVGFSGLAIMSPPVHGWAAFADWVVLYSFIYWPTYVLGLVLIVVSIFKLKKR